MAGHSSGAAVAAQLALDEPGRVATLILLELSLFSVPSGEAFLEGAGPVFDAYGRGEHEEALGMFLSAVSGLDRVACQQLLAERIPGAAEQALKDVDTFFGVELPGLTQWTFGPEQAAAVECPVLSVLGSDTQTAVGRGRRRSCARRSPTSRSARSTASATSCTSSAPSPSRKPSRPSSDATPSPVDEPRAPRLTATAAVSARS